MDDSRFDRLSRAIASVPRRHILGLIAGAALDTVLPSLRPDVEAGKGHDTKGHKTKRCPSRRNCGRTCCRKGQFCCDDARKVCCPSDAECCNPGPGTGSCCGAPNRCAQPVGDDTGAVTCCPPERQWFTTTGLVRCCPAGSRSLGTGISAEDGPCCPEAKYCSQSPTGGICCSNLAPVCIDPGLGRCCTEEQRCGNNCCNPAFGETCCGSTCCFTSRCYDCVNGSCVYRCASNEFCNRNGVCDSCGPYGCGG